MEMAKVFPEYIINEVGDKMIPCSGNLLFLKSCIYSEGGYPVRLLINEGSVMTCTFVVFVSDRFLYCIDTTSKGANFQGLLKIPTSTFSKREYSGFKYVVYVKETLF